MKCITKISAVEDVTLVTLEKVPAKSDFLFKIFNAVTNKQINVDMISQTASTGEYTTLSFTVNDNQMADVLAIANRAREKNNSIRPLVSSGNAKITIYGRQMPQCFGVASTVFEVLKAKNIDIILITTSDVDISILVTKADFLIAFHSLCEAFATDD
ncbi:MAG: amino acid-binding protein [Oscillospiraceae bacterium]|jgi:aspartokinase|nr:amino acid-binding protein [Oscillospiraceae bacterium]